ncbi:hypothetical protein D1872_329440 [compost metagenome]
MTLLSSRDKLAAKKPIAVKQMLPRNSASRIPASPARLRPTPNRRTAVTRMQTLTIRASTVRAPVIAAIKAAVENGVARSSL